MAAATLLTTLSVHAGTDDAAFAESLIRAGLPDYAGRVLATSNIPPDEAGVLRFLIRLRTGHLSDAKTSLQSLSAPDTASAWKMKLAYADACYSWNRIRECREMYESFLSKHPNGPPEELNAFYRDSVYRYAQTLLLLGDRPAARRVYGHLQKVRLDDAGKRQILAETAQITLSIAEELPAGKEKEDALQQVWITCEALAWQPDLWFGHAVVMMARVKMLRGDMTAAREILEDNYSTLEEIDALLRDPSAHATSPSSTP